MANNFEIKKKIIKSGDSKILKKWQKQSTVTQKSVFPHLTESEPHKKPARFYPDWPFSILLQFSETPVFSVPSPPPVTGLAP
jgi:hypothetical protein